MSPQWNLRFENCPQDITKLVLSPRIQGTAPSFCTRQSTAQNSTCLHPPPVPGRSQDLIQSLIPNRRLESGRCKILSKTEEVESARFQICSKICSTVKSRSGASPKCAESSSPNSCGAKKLSRRPVRELDRSSTSSLIASYAHHSNAMRCVPQTFRNA